MTTVKQGRVPAADFTWGRLNERDEVPEKLLRFSEACDTKLPLAVSSRIQKVLEAQERHKRARELHAEAQERKTWLERHMSSEEVESAAEVDPEDWVAPEVPDVPAANRRKQVYERAVIARLADLLGEIEYDSFFQMLEKAWAKKVEIKTTPSMTLGELEAKEAEIEPARTAILEVHRAVAAIKFTGPNHILKDFRQIDELVHAGEYWWNVTERPAAERAEALRVQKEKEQAAREARAGAAASTAKFRRGTHEAQQASDDRELEAVNG